MTRRRSAPSHERDAAHLAAGAYAAAIDGLTIPCACTDPRGRVSTVNAAFVDLLEYDSAAELLGVEAVALASEPALIQEAIAALHATGIWSGELGLRKRGGDPLTVMVSASTVCNAAGDVIGLVGSLMDITTTAQAGAHSRAALAESENRFRLVAENISEVTWLTQPGKQEMLYVSPAYERIWMRSCESLYASPHSWIEAIHPDDRVRVVDAAFTKQVLGTYDEEFRIVRPDGSVAWIRDRAVPVRDDAGTVYRIVGVAEDITRQKLGELTLATRARQQAAVAALGRQALESPPLDEFMGEVAATLAATLQVEFTKVLELAAGGGFFHLRAGAGWIPGLVGTAEIEGGLNSQAGFTLATNAPVIVTDLRTDTRFSGPALLREHGVISGMSVLIGDPRQPFGVLGAHTRDERVFTPDDVHFLQAVAHVLASVVQRDAHERDLLEREAYFRSLIENASDSITVVDHNGIITFQSPSSERTLGVPAESMVGHSAFELIHPEDAADVTDALRSAIIDPSEPVRVEFRVRRASGDWAVSEAVGRALPLADGIAVVVNARDVTDRRAAERKLQENQERLAQQARLLDKMQSAARIGGWEVDFETNQIIWTDGMYRILETSPAEFTPTFASTRAFHTDEGLARIGDAVAEMRRTGAGWDIEFDMRTANQRRIRVRAVADARVEDGEVRQMFGALQDVSELRQLQQRLLQSQKLEAIGQLSAGVAHDFNNLLTVIDGNASLLEAGGPVTGAQQDNVAQIHESVARASALTRQLLTFSQQRVMQPRDIDLNTSVADLTKMLRRVLGEDVGMEVRYASHPLAIHADPGMVDQIVLNLTVNARDAMPKGGRLTITTSAVDIDAVPGRNTATARVGSFACLSVSDTGSGIASHVLPRIFEPFFTTKAVGKGTGLGLATVHGIVEQHGGWISVETTLGLGTTFKVHLPRTTLSLTDHRDDALSDTDLRGSETILVAEDETAVQAVVERALTRLGYHVLVASTGAAAVRLWEQHAQTISLLVTDLVMPDGMSGMDLAAQLRQRNARLKVIWISGYNTASARSTSELREGVNFLQKPFDLSTLGALVRRALDAP